MANHFTNALYFYGEQKKLQALMDVLVVVIQKTQEGDYHEELVLAECGLSNETCREHGISFSDIPKFVDTTQLLVKAETRWSPKDLFFDVLANHFGITYASSSIDGSEWYIHNDLDETAFPENVLVDIWGNEDIPDAYEFFETYEKAISFLTERLGTVVKRSENETDESYLQCWNEYLKEEEIGCIAFAIRD